MTDYETEFQLNFNRTDRQVPDEFSELSVFKKEPLPGGGIRTRAEFEGFFVQSERKSFDGPEDYLIIGNRETGETRNLMEIVSSASDFGLVMERGYTGNLNVSKHLVEVPEPRTKGRVLSALHEILHVPQLVTETEENNEANFAARLAIREGNATEEQRQLVIGHERKDWNEVRKLVENLENDLKIKIIKDDKEYEDFVGRRLDVYRTYQPPEK